MSTTPDQDPKKENPTAANPATTEKPEVSKVEDTLAEDSIIETSSHQDPEMLVSTEEEVGSSEPEFSAEKASIQKKAEAKREAEDSLDEDALVTEHDKEETETLLSDEDLEQEETTDEDIHSDEDEHHDEHVGHELEMPDYAEFSPQALVSEAEKLLKNEEIHKIRDHFEAIRKSLMKQLNEERQHKLDEFLEQGGVEIDFEYIQPLREKFRGIFSEYRSKRQAFRKQRQDELQHNLTTKLQLIEKIKDLVNKDESIGDTFKEFNAIQQEWRNTGPVPRAESSDLYRNYHHHVENFYEYIKINKELRDLDFKKNREAKEELIAIAEKLAENEFKAESFKQLQDLHKKWKNLGPVDRENREPMWQRFSEATKKIHEQREEYYGRLREKADELLEQKRKLIARLEDLNYPEINTHHRWQEAIRKVDSIREEFRKIGRIHHPENDKIWDRFREVLRDFNHTKNQFYKSLKKEHHVNLEKKRELVEIAEQLKDSDDWRTTTNEMKRIQAQWKKIGHVPKSESDKIWKQFRGACNHYFDRLTDHNKERDKAFEGNYQQKEKMLEELKTFDTAEREQKENIGALKEIIHNWKELGRVPRNKQNIEAEFNKVLDQKFKSIDLDRKESQRIRYENKVESLSDQGGARQLRRERQDVNRSIEDAQKELNQLETNLSFFSSSNPKNPLIKDAENNIRKQREHIEMLEQKKKMLNVKIREMDRAEEDEEKGESS